MVDFRTHHRNIKAAIWPTLLLTLASWSVWLGGLAAVQQSCGSNYNPLLTLGIPRLPGVGGCSHLYQFWWWVWAFEFVIVVGIALSLAMGHLRSTRVMWTGLLAVVCVLKILGSDTFLFHRYRTTGTYHTRIKVTAAGFIMTSVFNLLLLILIALDPQPKDGEVVAEEHIATGAKTRTATTTRTVPTGAPATHLATEGHGPGAV